MIPGSEKAAPAAVNLLNKAVQGAHHTIDRVADGAAPAVRKLGENVTATTEALRLKTERLRESRDEWTESARVTVRGHPLTSVATALVLGFMIARLTR